METGTGRANADGVPLDDEDDWFAEPELDHDGPHDPDLFTVELPPPPREKRRLLSGRFPLAAAVLAAIGVFVIGALAVRAIGGSGDSSPTATPTTPAATTPAATTPVTTAPATTAPAATTPATTTPATTTPATTTPVTTTPGVITLPTDVTLKLGSSGDDVIAVQQALAQLGYDPGSVDGDFGPATQQAVVAFQTASGLTADGVVGPETLAALSKGVGSG
jgi:murein L,D-transpeptidase YcbB/YkuD